MKMGVAQASLPRWLLAARDVEGIPAPRTEERSGPARSSIGWSASAWFECDGPRGVISDTKLYRSPEWSAANSRGYTREGGRLTFETGRSKESWKSRSDSSAPNSSLRLVEAYLAGQGSMKRLGTEAGLTTSWCTTGSRSIGPVSCRSISGVRRSWWRRTSRLRRRNGKLDSSRCSWTC
jgi:hypothetical protein